MLLSSMVIPFLSSVCLRVGAMDNIKAKVPRTAYRGVVSVWFKDIKIHIAPEDLTNS
jgi:hypothetical protein